MQLRTCVYRSYAPDFPHRILKYKYITHGLILEYSAPLMFIKL